MRNSTKTGLMLGVAIGGLTAAAPAMAQDSQRAAVSDDAIIVTARRVEENLQDVPISITVFSDADLAKRNVTIASDLAAYTPSLSVNQRYGPERAGYAIRGFNQDQNTAPTVGVYFADVVGVRIQGGTSAGNTLGAGTFIDLQNVQVLKGPQGTLFGRNTTGGAVLLVPQKPTDNLEGYVEGTYGNYDQTRVQGVLNLPLADTFKVRVAVDRNKRDGYMKNLSGIGPSAYNDLDYTYARLSVLAELTPDLENSTIFHYSRSRTNGYGARITYCARDAVTDQPFNFTRVVYATAACEQIDRQAARGDGPRDIEASVEDPYLKLDTFQIINTTTWTASDSLTVKNIMSYGEYQDRSHFELNTSNFTVPSIALLNPSVDPASVGTRLANIELDAGPAGSQGRESTFTEELQLQFESADGRFSGVAGGYLEFSRPINWNSGRTSIFATCSSPADLVCNTPLGFAIISQSETKLRFDNKGIFAQGTYDFTDQLALTVGGRWTFDKIVGLGRSTRYTFLNNASLMLPPGTLPEPVLFSLTCNDVVRHPTVDISDPVNLPPAFGGIQINAGDGSGDVNKCLTRLVEKSDKPTWLINLDYKPTPDILIYAKYARGYRQGGMVFTNPGLETFGPEKVDNYEIGLKASFNGAVRGYFNIAGFWNDFSDQQVILQSIAKQGSGLAGGNVIGNAGKTRIRGIEVDTSALFFDSLRLSVGYTYLDTKVLDFIVPTIDDPNSPFERLQASATPGGSLTQSPKHKLTASASYTLPLDESVGDVSVGATFTYSSKQFFDANSPVGTVPSVSMLNLNFDWKRVADSPFDLSVFATNVTNETYAVAAGLGDSSFGFENLLYNPPRMYGVRVRFNFGQ